MAGNAAIVHSDDGRILYMADSRGAEPAIAAKRADYFAAGIEVVWDVSTW